ncbi:transcriptional regulator BetI [Crateriforma conspicua]|uniref:Transcriptional regulator BetI n=1 Tax=Crateriforma conspicua TaxID=2527996 RepID=A0A5C6FMT0_9PLAN|nr:transcriptional regulator BetI [Crateriforma conspicua]
MCAQQGIAETNLRQIAREANVSNGTLHYYFPSKDKLIETMIIRAVERMGQPAAEIASRASEPFAQIAEIIDLSFGLFDDDWELYSVALLLGDRIRVRLAQEFPTATGALKTIIEGGQRQGVIRDGDAVLLAIQCHGIIMRVARARAFGEVSPPLRQFADMVAESCRLILVTQP